MVKKKSAATRASTGRRSGADLDQLRSSPGNGRFEDLCGLVVKLGFVLRSTSGSHHIYRHAALPHLFLNLQRAGNGKAKPYQVRQVLEAIESNDLEVE